ncbi:hypothetical protein [Enterocloster citroniae]|uniref:Phage protein n=2 Tax=Enterocloster citroniae TaxID=358743 RepID=A0ABV2G3C6_9FIRM|nr:hypothetical protein [Enterocloster citroniae]KMW23674.1 hypothetical protein HMPREF9470_00890 [[Clostridium] citroniae WAL-19142]
MIDIVETIEKYWVQEILAGISGALAWLGRKVHHWKQEQDLVKQGVLAILHDRLYQACQYYLRKGYCSIDDRDNLEYMFQPYKALGGNGTGEELYNRCLALPYESESEGDNEKD